MSHSPQFAYADSYNVSHEENCLHIFLIRRFHIISYD